MQNLQISPTMNNSRRRCTPNIGLAVDYKGLTLSCAHGMSSHIEETT